MSLLPALSRRLRPEVMDQPGLDPGRHRQALRGLGRINFWSGSAGILWPLIADLARHSTHPPRVLDLATGGGDVPIRLWQKARRARLPIVVEGCDVSPVAVEHATRQAERRGAEVRFFVADALAGDLPAGYDALVCSLFLHHLTEDQALGLLRRMAAAAGLVLVNDLRRSRAGLLLALVGTHLLSLSPVVHTDGPRSVEGAFTIAEARALADRAGLAGATVERRWPCRFLLTWVRP
ncbi:MAG TPA: methyltransferase domain-containing protein [Gemmataceae bacterium]|nr:methyltransferase domain-containing protein [Gemmataceae bacterium]